ncbi:hypothetical protein B296_00020072 [Ensete ventricosum]|uniref:Uncharacterized protein n=1 Tax=Ensete ventricosum TaxID=4639 RepID=A0A426YE51_ENSVE|nr:hypothetical protein B296_00020072 [Ensete ventricosum]
MSLDQSHCFEYGGGRYVARGPATLLPTANTRDVARHFSPTCYRNRFHRCLMGTRLIRLNPRRLRVFVVIVLYGDQLKIRGPLARLDYVGQLRASGFGGVGGWVTHPRLSRSNPCHRTGGTSPTPSTMLRIPSD